MSLTRVDCGFYRGDRFNADSASYAAINPTKKPGSLVMAASAAARESIGGQVAAKLALGHFMDGVLEFFADVSRDIPGPEGEPVGVQDKAVGALEAAFKRANHSVYTFGHKLAAGGRMAASLLGLIVEGHLIAAGRVGYGSAYLIRSGELFPFFEDQPEPDTRGFIGTNALIEVELASVPVEASDILIALSRSLTPRQHRELGRFAVDGHVDVSSLERMVKRLFGGEADAVAAMAADVGPETIYLAKAV